MSGIARSMAVAALTVAVTTSFGASAEPASPLTGTSWVLVDLLRGPDVPVAGRRLKVTFDPNGSAGAVAGFAGCNNLAGRYQVHGSDLSFERLGLTRKACGPDRHELELAMVNGLRETRSWRFAGRRLEFRDGSGATVLVWRRPHVGGQSTPNR